MTALPPAKPPFGKLRVENADHFAAVYINDRFMGHASSVISAQASLLNPDIRLGYSSNGFACNRFVTIEADKTVIVR